jgi:hypothetical protein
MHAVAITPLYAGILGLVLLALSYRVSHFRLRFKVGIGDGGRPEVAQAMRVQANFVEYVPLCLVMVLLVELTGHPAWLVHALGGVLTVGRLLHAWGFSRNPNKSPGRFAGIIATWLVLLAASLILILDFLR